MRGGSGLCPSSIMDFVQFFRNVRRSGQIAPGWWNRWTYLRWLYRAARRESGVWRVKFRHPAVPAPFELELRENAGSDSYVFGEIFDHGCYAVPLATAPRTILDLGGNAGLAAVYFSRRWPE